MDGPTGGELMKNFFDNFNWTQAIGITLILLAIIFVFASIVLFMFAKLIPGCICLAVMLICVFIIAGTTN